MYLLLFYFFIIIVSCSVIIIYRQSYGVLCVEATYGLVRYMVLDRVLKLMFIGPRCIIGWLVVHSNWFVYILSIINQSDPHAEIHANQKWAHLI